MIHSLFIKTNNNFLSLVKMLLAHEVILKSEENCSNWDDALRWIHRTIKCPWRELVMSATTISDLNHKCRALVLKVRFEL